jgi:hypothetical protein
MSRTLDVVQHILAAPVTTGGTITVIYPTGRGRGDYFLGRSHRIDVNGTGLIFPRDFTVVMNAASAVFTLTAAVTLPANVPIFVTFDRGGGANSSLVGQLRDLGALTERLDRTVTNANLVLVQMGTPVAASAVNIAGSQTIGAGASYALNGALVTAGVAIADTPRNVVWTCGTSMVGFTLRVTGTDEYGAAMVEDFVGVSGAAVTGKKAFARVTSCAVTGSGTPAASTIGFGALFGLPLSVGFANFILRDFQDGVTATAGAVVAAVSVAQSATSGDVRGTWTPNVAADGTKNYALWLGVASPDIGPPQFAG